MQMQRSLHGTLDKKPETDLTCKPLDTMSDIKWFLDHPPPWRTLCRPLTPHSKAKIKNIDKVTGDIDLETPENYCHYDRDTEPENVIRYEESTLPKTLVCHDMANGYHDDCHIDGTSNYLGYTFYNWAGIDIFCYFSHHLITIPPLAWINVGHDHGVKVIGTIITEWAEGAEFWQTVLESEKESTRLANALVNIASTLKFDGWLLNIENKISDIDALLNFVRTLHRLLHKELPEGVLIWYDSVTIKGNLNWQNGLNEKNKAFFDACDGIFTNYSWEEADLKASVEMAGSRIFDLFVGVDIWGRNFYGGGQFNTQEAVAKIHEHGCSWALFAPAWTHEAMSWDKYDINGVGLSEGMDKFAQYTLRDRALWGSLWPYLCTRVPCELPFKTSFCRGLGKQRRMYGEVLCNTPWYNLRHQNYQANSAHGSHGYMLRPFDPLLGGSTEYKEQRGILRFRESFEPTERQASSLTLHEGSRTAAPSRGHGHADVEEKREEEGHEVNKKTSFFQRRLETKPSTNIKRHSEETDHMDAGPSVPTLSTPMMMMSVNLKLGKQQRRNYGLSCVPDEQECLELYLEDSFNGGGCLRVHPSDENSPQHRYIRLLQCDFLLEATTLVCLVTKSKNSRQSLNIHLRMQNAEGFPLTVVLIGRQTPQMKPQSPAARGQVSVAPVQHGGRDFQDLRAALLLAQPSYYVPVENDYGWDVLYYKLSLAGCRVTSVNCHTLQELGSILLGHFAIVPLNLGHQYSQ